MSEELRKSGWPFILVANDADLAADAAALSASCLSEYLCICVSATMYVYVRLSLRLFPYFWSHSSPRLYFVRPSMSMSLCPSLCLSVSFCFSQSHSVASTLDLSLATQTVGRVLPNLIVLDISSDDLVKRFSMNKIKHRSPNTAEFLVDFMFVYTYLCSAF